MISGYTQPRLKAADARDMKQAAVSWDGDLDQAQGEEERAVEARRHAYFADAAAECRAADRHHVHEPEQSAQTIVAQAQEWR